MIGYALPAVLLAGITLGRYWSELEFVPPLSWLLAGRTEFALGGFLTAMILTTPMRRLPKPRDRRSLGLFIVIFVILCSVWPFLAPAFNRSLQSSLTTRVDQDGVCWQGTDYNCGPAAAAVTALRRLGFPAEEGELAIAARTTQAMGTPPDVLALALHRTYGAAGLSVDYRHFRNVRELNQDGLTLAVIKFGLLVDHYVAVLEVTDKEVVVGDPFRGKATCSHAEFARVWRFTGVVLRKRNAPAPSRA